MLIPISNFIRAYSDLITKNLYIGIDAKSENFQLSINIGSLNTIINQDTLIYQIVIPLISEQPSIYKQIQSINHTPYTQCETSK